MTPTSTGGPGTRPPRWAVRLLEATLPQGTPGESVRADLHEEFLEIERRDGAGKARRWYGREATKLAVHFLAGALRPNRDGQRRRREMGRWRQNLRIAHRHLTRAPAFAALAVGTMAIGIGATVSIFSVVDAVLLAPLPYENADELVVVWEWNRPRDRTNNVVNPGNFSAWRARNTSFAEMTAVTLTQPTTVLAGDEADEAMTQYAQPGFFQLLGVVPVVGRAPTARPDPTDDIEVVLSRGYWLERFGGTEDVLGRTLDIDGRSVVVVGVLGGAYVPFGEGTDVWASIPIDRGDQTNTGRYLMVLGRLAPGVSFEVADAELASIASGLEEEFPDFNGGWGVNLVPLDEEIVGAVEGLLWILLGAVGLLLLIACGNVANLLLVRATERQSEMALRTSLGASGRDLVGQLLTESALLASAGALAGVGLAHAATGWIVAASPSAFDLPRVQDAGVDGGVLLFAAVLAAGTALLFGLLPAIQAARVSPARLLASEGRGSSRRTGRIRDALVVAEVAVSVALLAGAVLLARSFESLLAVDDGIEVEQVLVGRVNLSSDAYDGDAAKIAFFEELLGEIGRGPGVAAVGGVTFLPMDGSGSATGYWPADREAPRPEDRRAADIRNVAGAYFDAMGIELLQGRLFDERDRADAPQTVVVNRSLAQRYWPDRSAVGEQVVISWIDDTPWEIIGVVEDVRVVGPSVEPREAIYIHYAHQTFFSWLHLTVRATGAPEPLISRVRTELAELDETLPLGDVRVMQDVVDRSVARPRMTRTLMLLFAAIATLLAAVGLYGTLSYSVSRRAREIGVRIALGAAPRGLVRMVAMRAGRLVVVGLALGIAVALAGTRLLSGLLFQVTPSDGVSLSAAVLVLGVVSLTACVVPALRAVRVAPVEALREE